MALQSLSNNFNSDLHIFLSKLTIYYFKSCYQFSKDCRNQLQFLWVKVNKIVFFFSVVFEEPEDPTNRSFFSEIISSISDVKFSNSGRYMISRDYLSVKVWDLHMETKPIETYTVSNQIHFKFNCLRFV